MRSIGDRGWGDGKWGDEEMGRWGDGEMGRWGDGEMGMGNGRREGHNCDEQTKKPQREIET